MTDGPFRNLKLGSRWKRFAEAVQTDSIDTPERHALVAHALVHETLDGPTQALLRDLRAYLNHEQLDLDPLSSIENIFNRHSRTAFSDTYQKELCYRLYEQIPPVEAFRSAMTATVIDLKNIAQSRIEEECIRSYESGEMRGYQLKKTVTQARAVFRSLATDEICNAIYAGDRNAFRSAASRKTGLDDGPSL